MDFRFDGGGFGLFGKGDEGVIFSCEEIVGDEWGGGALDTGDF